MDEQLETIRENAEHAGDIYTIIARLEAATGPDRDIDAAIQRTTDGRVLHIGCGGLTNAFTGSIEAALALVPRGYMWSVAKYNAGDGDAFVHLPGGGVKSATAKTPAIALCVAALKARAALIAEERGT